MKNLTYEEKKEILDFFKEELNNYVIYYALSMPFSIVKYDYNPIELEKYKAFATLSIEQQEKICDLLSETASHTLFNFLKIFEDYKDDIELVVRKNGNEYNMVHLSEKIANEITFYEDITKRKQNTLQKVTCEEADELPYEKIEEILDFLGEKIIKDAVDNSLYKPLEIAKCITTNPIHLENYKILSTLSIEQQEKTCKLLFETITGVIFNFLRMTDHYYDCDDCDDNIELHLIIKKDGKEYDMFDISDYMGVEVVYDGEEGWIQKFSKFKNLVL